mmetsp:Transcript_49369/g.139809  ORF Transcript_49369/g.139809 Transcript_49369/m.139809 type:complete len:201 (-) Transcript_49369:273-875(-)
MSVKVELGQLLDQPLRLVQRKELGNTHTDESCFRGIFEGEVDPLNDLPRLLKFTQEHILRWHIRSHHALHLREEATEAVFECHNLIEGLTEHAGEREQAQRVAGGRRVEDDHIVVHRLHLLHELRKAHRLIDARNGFGEVLHQRLNSVGLRTRPRHLSELVHLNLRIDLHTKKVVVPGDSRRVLAELLCESIAKIVRGVR